MFRTLDVGCGSKPRGDVNLDLLVPEDEWKKTVNPKQIPNFVKADASYLPFRSNSFELSIASHLIEHSPYPSRIVLEMLRVSKKVKVIVPNELQMFLDLLNPKKRTWVKKHHAWNSTLNNLLKLFSHLSINIEIHRKLLEYEIKAWK